MCITNYQPCNIFPKYWCLPSPGLTNPGDECLDFKAMHDGVKAQKEKCTKVFLFLFIWCLKRKVKAQTCALKHKHLSFPLQGSEEGSFGDCRKQERMAAKFGNKCKQSCPGLHHCHRHISLTNIATNKIIIVIINVLKKPCPCFRQCHYHFKPSLPSLRSSLPS